MFTKHWMGSNNIRSLICTNYVIWPMRGVFLSSQAIARVPYFSTLMEKNVNYPWQTAAYKNTEVTDHLCMFPNPFMGKVSKDNPSLYWHSTTKLFMHFIFAKPLLWSHKSKEWNNCSPDFLSQPKTFKFVKIYWTFDSSYSKQNLTHKLKILPSLPWFSRALQGTRSLGEKTRYT